MCAQYVDKYIRCNCVNHLGQRSTSVNDVGNTLRYYNFKLCMRRHSKLEVKS